MQDILLIEYIVKHLKWKVEGFRGIQGHTFVNLSTAFILRKKQLQFSLKHDIV